MIAKKKSTKCVFSICVEKDTRTKADELGKKLDRSRSKIVDIAIKELHEKNKG